jgi:hypothetical protein
LLSLCGIDKFRAAREVRIGDSEISTLFGWLVADGWCWFVLREEYCWLVDGGWFVVREKYCWLVADKPSENGADPRKPDFGWKSKYRDCHCTA